MEQLMFCTVGMEMIGSECKKDVLEIMKMNIRPIGDKLLVEYVEPKDRTDGGIILPGVSKQRPTTGVVRAVGPGRILQNGRRNPMFVKVGDKVLISFSGQELNNRDEKLRIIDIQDVLAIEN